MVSFPKDPLHSIHHWVFFFLFFKLNTHLCCRGTVLLVVSCILLLPPEFDLSPVFLSQSHFIRALQVVCPWRFCISENVVFCILVSFKICSASSFLFLWGYWTLSSRLYYYLYKYVRPIKLFLFRKTIVVGFFP